MAFLFFLLLSYLLQFSKDREIYQCSRNNARNSQCLNKWVDAYGNTRIDLWKCSSNKFCQILSRKDENNSIGVCTLNYKKLYDQDYCSYNSECSSLYCSEKKCQGIGENELCHPGSFQCKNNLVCKKKSEFYPYKEVKDIYRCHNLSQLNQTCENDNECDIKLVCANRYIINIINNSNANNLSELNEKVLFEEYISLKKRNKSICINRASIENGLPATDPMICKSGDTINFEIFPNYTENLCASKKEIIQDCNDDFFCIIKVNLGKFGDVEIKQNCIYTVRGNAFCPLNQKEEAWKNYLNKYDEYYSIAKVNKKRNTSIHIPVHKNTFNILEVSQAYWYYSEWIYSIDADSCTKEFFFLRNNGTFLNFSVLFILILLLFI